MKVDNQKLDLLIQAAKRIKSANNQFEKFRDKLADLELTQKQRDKARNNMEQDAEYIEDQLHELHCLAVELGIADLDESRYGDKEISSANGWATLKKKRRRPVL